MHDNMLVLNCQFHHKKLPIIYMASCFPYTFRLGLQCQCKYTQLDLLFLRIISYTYLKLYRLAPTSQFFWTLTYPLDLDLPSLPTLQITFNKHLTLFYFKGQLCLLITFTKSLYIDVQPNLNSFFISHPKFYIYHRDFQNYQYGFFSTVLNKPY